MAISRTLSHLPGRYWLNFAGTDFMTILHNGTLNVINSFTILFYLHIDPNLFAMSYQPYTYILFTKGHPTDPSLGSVSGLLIDHFLWIFLHDSNGTTSLVYKSAEPFMPTCKRFHLAIVWDTDKNELRVLKNNVRQTMVLQTGAGRHSTAAAMGTINTNSSDFVFGKGTGQVNFKGQVVHARYSDYAWPDGDILKDYTAMKYNGFESCGYKILFTSDFGSGTEALYEMDISGGDIRKLASIPNIPAFPIRAAYDQAGAQYVATRIDASNQPTDILVYGSTEEGRIPTASIRVGNDSRFVVSTGGFYYSRPNHPAFSPNGRKLLMARGSSVNTAPAPYVKLSAHGFETLHPTSLYDSSFGIAWNHVYLKGTKIVTHQQNGGAHTLPIGTVASDGSSYTQIGTLNSAGTAVSTPCINNAGDTVLHSDNSLGNYAIFKQDWTDYTHYGAPPWPVALTDGTKNCYVAAYTPDDSKIVYTEMDGSFNRIGVMNWDGTGQTLITPPNYNCRAWDVRSE